jgi:hypothetical protein
MPKDTYWASPNASPLDFGKQKNGASHRILMYLPIRFTEIWLRKWWLAPFPGWHAVFWWSVAFPVELGREAVSTHTSKSYLPIGNMHDKVVALLWERVGIVKIPLLFSGRCTEFLADARLPVLDGPLIRPDP